MAVIDKKRADDDNRHRRKEKVRKLNQTACYVQAWIHMTRQHQCSCFLTNFNAGEGLQHFCTEHQIKLLKIDHILLSRVCSETAGGLPGLLLTLDGMGDKVNVWGSSDLTFFVDAMKSFIPRAAMVHSHSFGPPPGSNGSPSCLPKVFDEPLVLIDDDVVKTPAVLLRPTCSEATDFTEPKKPDGVSVIYICELPEIKGKFDPKKAVSLGLRPGPKYRELQLVNSVKSDCEDIMFHLRPYASLGIDRSNIPNLSSPSDIIKELLSEIPEIADASKQVGRFWSGDSMDAYEIMTEESSVPSCLVDISREDMEIVLLGTGSSQPSKYRNNYDSLDAGEPVKFNLGKSHRAADSSLDVSSEIDRTMKKLLVELVEKHGIRKWSTIAQRLSGRIGKQCRERWHNHLKPDIKKDRWSEEEDKILIEAHRQLGNKWAEIARNLPGRSENTIKNHWNATKRRQLSSRKNGNSSSSKPNTPLQNYIRSVISTTSSDCMDQHSSSSSSITPTADNALMVNNLSTSAGTSESFLKLSPPLDTDQIHVQFDLQKEIDFMEMLSYGYI